MIKIARDVVILEAAVSDHAPTWQRRAATRTAANRRAGRHVGSNAMWSEIKVLFIALQWSKCAYCERKLGAAAIEWDIEHFRPKKDVEVWPLHRPARYEPGYHLLAYDLRNYLLACKVCNSTNKASYFPVLSGRRTDTADPVEVRLERPILLNPLDSEEVDPAVLITFLGPTPQPVAEFGPDHERAATIIEILDLNRDDIVLERADLLLDVWVAFQAQSMAAPHGERARRRLHQLADPSSPHASCVRRFVQLCHRDEAAAEQLVIQMEQTVAANRPTT